MNGESTMQRLDWNALDESQREAALRRQCLRRLRQEGLLSQNPN